jgi:hypothetical protein
MQYPVQFLLLSLHNVATNCCFLSPQDYLKQLSFLVSYWLSDATQVYKPLIGCHATIISSLHIYGSKMQLVFLFDQRLSDATTPVSCLSGWLKQPLFLFSLQLSDATPGSCLSG